MKASEPGYIEDKAALQHRLRRIEGQVRGLQRLVEEEAYCIAVLTQITAVTRALQAVALELLDDHLSNCLLGPEAGGEQGTKAKLAEATAAIARLVRS
jgi:DNA-binding FrmR family transcriptional regulator